MHIENMVKRSFDQSVKSGWHDEPRTFGDLIALIHSEVSEALEAFRENDPGRIWYDCQEGKEPKPEGVPIELADIVIRIGDLCGRYNIDLASAIETKMAYNATRSHRHGNKKL